GDYSYGHSTYLSSGGYFQDGEWHNTFASLFRYAGVVRRFGDLPTRSGGSPTDSSATLFANGYDNATPWYYRSNSPDSPSYTSSTNSASVVHVIELVLS
ncbi:hypothetical protein, partial [Salmonella enterica]